MICMLLWGVSDLFTPRDVHLKGKYGVSHVDVLTPGDVNFNMEVTVRGRTFEGGEVCKDKNVHN